MKYKSLNLSLIVLFSLFIGTSFFSQNAYAAYSASISRTSSGAVTLSDSSGGSIKPSSTGTLGTGSDTVSVSSNCTAGYNLYVSAISGGSTNLTTSGGLDYIPSTTTATGSEAALSKDTWGIGKDGVTFSKLQSYSEDLSTMSPLYTGASSISSPNKEYTIYYGVNVSTAKTPGTYTGDVLYTVLMNGACLEYTLKFDTNGATTSNLPDGTTGNEYPSIKFGQAVDLSEYSTTDKISKTGYHLSGWKIKNGDGTLLPTNNNTSLDDGESSELTLIAQWEANTYTIKYAAGSTGGTCNVSDTPATYDQNVTLSSTKCTKSGAEQKGWSTTSSATNTKTYDLGVTLTKPNLTSTNNGSITLYPYFESTTTYFQTTNSCSTIPVGATGTLVDSRDNQSYTVYRWPNSGTAGAAYPTDMAGYCIMTKDLSLGYVTGGSITRGSNLVLSTDTSAGSTTSSAPIYARTEPSDWSGTNTDSNLQYINGPQSDKETYSSHSYYSYGAAQKVCPKGWSLPTKTQYDNIATFMGGNSSSGSSKIRGTPYNFVYGGYFYSSGWDGAGSYGRCWSSTQYNSSNGYYLAFSSGGLSTSYSGGKYVGRSVRCIAAL